MPTNSTLPPASTDRGGWCCLLLSALPAAGILAWILAASSILPEEVFWFPIWLGAVVWNGTDGQGGISHWLG
ncbi:hypothetical protein [Streptomyces luteireticuli]|uniref:hypothetical protein n=1 Tax=Streptomyces luteireticuli TaxID=173858 RepID=UPI003556D972